MIHYIFSISARRIFCCQNPLQLIIASSIPVPREWTRIVVNGPGPGARYYHTMKLVGSKLFVFGGLTTNMRLNDIWALDLSCGTFAARFPDPF